MEGYRCTKLGLLSCHRLLILDARGKQNLIFNVTMDALLAQQMLANSDIIFVYQSYITAFSAFPSKIKGSVLISFIKIHHGSRCRNSMCLFCLSSNRLHMGRQTAFIFVTFIKIM